jgi:hypothetical protein
MTQDSIPGFGGNLIEVGIVTNGTNRAVYMSKAYPANANGTQRPGAVVEYGSEFSVGEGIGGVEVTIPEVLPAGYLEAEFLMFGGNACFDTLVPAEDDVGMSAEFTPAFIADVIFAGARGAGAGARLYMSRHTMGGYLTAYGWNGWNYFPEVVTGVIGKWYYGEINLKNSRLAKISDGVNSSVVNLSEVLEANGYNIYLGCANSQGSASLYWGGNCRSFIVTKGNNVVCDFVPVLKDGKAAFWDKVSKTLFENTTSSRLGVGLTLSQALKLSDLPAGGGTLTVSLPTGYDSDPGVTSALAKAEANGWVITIQTYTPEAEAAASTFALRRVWVRKNENEQGSYVDSAGTRWQVDWCVDIIGADPEQEGYEMFRSVEAATEYWGLTLYVDPEAEEEFSQEL